MNLRKGINYIEHVLKISITAILYCVVVVVVVKYVLYIQYLSTNTHTYSIYKDKKKLMGGGRAPTYVYIHYKLK